MKIRYVILIGFIILIGGYVAGQFVPWALLHPVVIDKSITINDYYTRLVSIVGALATLFATLIALFKEDIKKMYEYAALNVNFKDPNILSEIIDSEVTTSSSQGLSAKKYEVAISIQNRGKLAARGCQVHLEQLHFKHSSFPAPKEVQVSGKPLSWIGKTDSSVIIPSKAKGFINIIEIISPQSEIVSAEDKPKTHGKPVIKISGSDFYADDYNGIYKCIFTIYSENSSPIEFTVDINWNGNWQQRLAEMKDCVTITSTISKKS